MGQIGQVRTKVGQLLGVLGRASAVLGGGSLLSLYNGLVLPHLQYCLMVWGDFQGCGNVTLGPWGFASSLSEEVCRAGGWEEGTLSCGPTSGSVWHVENW